MEFAVAPDGKPMPIASANEKACRLHLRIVGPYLLVEDNHTCRTALFDGIYERS